MRTVGAKQAGRCTMCPLTPKQDQLVGVDIVELIDLELAGKDGQIPFEEIDKHLLARPVHRAEGRAFVDRETVSIFV